MHMFWTCKSLKHFWLSILNIIKKVVGSEIPTNPRLTLLGDHSVLPNNLRGNTRFVRLTLTFTEKVRSPLGYPFGSRSCCLYLPSEKIMFNVNILILMMMLILDNYKARLSPYLASSAAILLK